MITDLALLGFTADTREMEVLALQPGVTLADVQARTGFELRVNAPLGVLDPPGDEELAIVRTLDPDGYLLG